MGGGGEDRVHNFTNVGYSFYFERGPALVVFLCGGGPRTLGFGINPGSAARVVSCCVVRFRRGLCTALASPVVVVVARGRRGAGQRAERAPPIINVIVRGDKTCAEEWAAGTWRGCVECGRDGEGLLGSGEAVRVCAAFRSMGRSWELDRWVVGLGEGIMESTWGAIDVWGLRCLDRHGVSCADQMMKHTTLPY